MNDIQNHIYKYLADRIAGKDILDKLPTEVELAEQFQTTRFNAQCAVRELEKAGIVERTRNKKLGTRVRTAPSCFLHGKLLKNVSRKLCILNFATERFLHIHWNNRLVEPLNKKLLKAGISIEERPVGGIRDVADFQALAEKIVSEGVNAFLIIPGGRFASSAFSCSSVLSKLHDRIFVYAFDFSHWDASAYNIVEINNFADGCTAGEAVIRAGAGRILYCSCSEKSFPWNMERFRGVTLACLRSGFPPPECVPNENEDFFPLTHSEPNTVIIASNDMRASKLITAGRKLNLQPGADYKIIGFDGNPEYASFEF